MMKNWEFRSAMLFVATVLFVLVFSVVPSLAQATTGTLSGTVSDAKGAVVPNATVKIKSDSTGIEVTTVTNGDGIFTAAALQPGSYSVTTEAKGFKRVLRTGVEVKVGIVNPVDVTLEAGNIGETVTITGSGGDEVLQTEQSQISSTLNTRQVQDLPSNGAGGGIDTLALLIPGVIANRAGGTNTNGSGLSVNGNRGRSNNFQIDGGDNNDLTVGGPALFVDIPDAVQEYQVITNNFSAQYGRNQGAIVNIVGKGGTNDFHGSAFLYHQDNIHFNSNNNINVRSGVAKSPNLYTVFGGTVGGPLYLPTIGDKGPGVTRMTDKAFFFFAYQGIRNPATFTGHSSTTTGLGVMASEFGKLTANFPGNPATNAIVNFSPFAIPGAIVNTTSGGTVSQAQILTPFTTAGCARAIPVGATPAAGCVYTTPNNPSTGQPYLIGGSYDIMNFGSAAAPILIQGARYERTLADPYTEDYFNARIDVRPSSRDSVRWSFTKQNQLNTRGTGTFSQGWLGDVPATSKNTSGNWTRTVSNTMFNDLRLSYASIGVEFGGGCSVPTPGCIGRPEGSGRIGENFTNIAYPTSLGITTTNRMPTLGPATNLPQGRLGKVYQIADNFTKVWGRHSVIFGGEFKYIDTFVPFLPAYNGAFTFNSLARIQNDWPSAITIADGNEALHFIERDKYWFIQDDFKARPNLTLNLGVRYENTGQPVNTLNDLTVPRESGGAPFFNPAVPLANRVVPRIPTDNNNFAPRLGFAYSPHFWKKLFGEDQTVFRGGYSIAYEPAFYNILLNVATAAPSLINIVVPTASLPASAANIGPMPNNPFGPVVRANATAQGVLARGSLNPIFLTQTRVGSDFHAPYSEQYSFGMQRQFGRKHIAEVRYVGNHGVGLFQSINDNFFIGPLVNGFTAGGVTYPGFAAFAGIPVNGTCTGIIGPFDNVNNCLNRQYNAAGITTRKNTGNSNYNSLQASYHGRFYKDSLALSMSYTFSKTIDDVSEIFNFDGTSPNAQNPFCINICERSISNLDRPQAFSMNWVYDVPYFKEQRGFAGHILGGWQMNGTYILTDGSPYTPDNFINANVFGLGATYLTAGDRPFYGSQAAPVGSVGISQADANRVFGIACNPAPCSTNFLFWSMNAINNTGTAVPVTVNDVRFIINGPGAARIFGTPFGNVPRNALRGPRYNQMNFSIFKTTKIRERVSAQFRMEAFNVLNHPNPGIGVARNGSGYLPSNNLTNAGISGSEFANFGDIQYAVRVIQLGVRLIF